MTKFSWSQEIYAVTSYIDLEHIKGKYNVLVDSLSRLKTLGLYETNDPEEPGNKCGKSIFDSESDMICDITVCQHAKSEFKNERY